MIERDSLRADLARANAARTAAVERARRDGAVVSIGLACARDARGLVETLGEQTAVQSAAVEALAAAARRITSRPSICSPLPASIGSPFSATPSPTRESMTVSIGDRETSGNLQASPSPSRGSLPVSLSF